MNIEDTGYENSVYSGTQGETNNDAIDILINFRDSYKDEAT